MRLDKSVWILEDDPGCTFVYEQIVDIRYETRYFSKINEFQIALEDSSIKRPSLLIVDLKLADGSFLGFLSKPANKELITMPFIVVSSTDDLDALRFCYNEGATDYLVKPFRHNELVVKIEQTLKQSAVESYGFSKEFICKDNLAPKFGDLTLKESSILSLFMKSNHGRVSREEIMNHVWSGVTVQNKTVDVHLHNLRKKIQTFGMSIKSTGAGEWIFSECADGDFDFDKLDISSHLQSIDDHTTSWH